MRRAARSACVSFALFAGFLPAMLVVAPDVQAESLEQIPLHYRMAEELLPILRPLAAAGFGHHRHRQRAFRASGCSDAHAGA